MFSGYITQAANNIWGIQQSVLSVISAAATVPYLTATSLKLTNINHYQHKAPCSEQTHQKIQMGNVSSCPSLEYSQLCAALGRTQ